MTSLEVAAPATMPAAPAAPPPAPKGRIAQKRTENWSDLALPFSGRPSLLQRDLAADAGFDPLSLASSKVQLYDYREAEIKHARLAMLAAAGWPLAELWDTGLAKTLGLRPIIEDNNSLSPSVLNGGMGMVSPVYWVAVLALAAGVEAISEYKKGQAKAADSNWMHTGSYVPGNLGFDPLGLYTVFGKNESGKMLMETAEIKNGRLAMLAITVYALEEAILKPPVVQNSAFLFEPFWKTVENLMFTAPPLYSQVPAAATLQAAALPEVAAALPAAATALPEMAVTVQAAALPEAAAALPEATSALQAAALPEAAAAVPEANAAR